MAAEPLHQHAAPMVIHANLDPLNQPDFVPVSYNPNLDWHPDFSRYIALLIAQLTTLAERRTALATFYALHNQHIIHANDSVRLIDTLQGTHDTMITCRQIAQNMHYYVDTCRHAIIRGNTPFEVTRADQYISPMRTEGSSLIINYSAKLVAVFNVLRSCDASIYDKATAYYMISNLQIDVVQSFVNCCIGHALLGIALITARRQIMQHRRADAAAKDDEFHLIQREYRARFDPDAF